MAKVKEIKVGIGATINLGNYENVKPHAEVVMEVEPGESIEDVYQAAWEITSGQIRDQWRNIKKVNK